MCRAYWDDDTVGRQDQKVSGRIGFLGKGFRTIVAWLNGGTATGPGRGAKGKGEERELALQVDLEGRRLVAYPHTFATTGCLNLMGP